MMNWKYIIILVSIVLIITTGIIVWNNRGSDKLVSNFLSVTILGLGGLLISSLTSLKEEKNEERFAAVLFLEKKELSIVTQKYILPQRRISEETTITNNAITNLQIKNERFKDLDNFKNAEYWNLVDNLMIRYIFDLLSNRYSGHWYRDFISIPTPGPTFGQGRAIEYDLPKKEYNWKELSKVFQENDFIKIGYFTNLETGEKVDFGISFPENTSIKLEKTKKGCDIAFDNKFININIIIEHVIPVENVNSALSSVFNIRKENENNYKYQPFIIEFEITKKKFRSGHPNMKKYEYWANDLKQLIKENISIEQFWEVVNSYQKK